MFCCINKLTANQMLSSYMWVSYQMSMLTWPTRLTDLNTKGQAEAIKSPLLWDTRVNHISQ